MNRGDLEAGNAFYDDDVESIFDPRWIAIGFENSRGRKQRLRTLTQFYAETRELRFEPGEIIDLGDDRVLVTGRMKGSGLNSGAPFDNEWANLATISGGFVVRDQVFMNHLEALEAVGLSV
ncbi:MAG: hypothetical protein QOG62_1753 [Thermoleophilaceae bacterium]|nr:hypothetical protein [Thermoleophilaceae bacterium]